MTQIIGKFALNPYNKSIQINKNAKILTVHIQKGNVFLWAIIDLDMPLISRGITRVATGQGLSVEQLDTKKGQYIGTAFLANESYVFHFFDHGEIAL